MSNILKVQNLHQWFGNNHVLCDINFQIPQGQFVALVGGSGCGKSTLLKAILGTNPPKKGKICIGDLPVTGPNRNVGIVYQAYGLYRFLTAEQLVAFGLKLDQTTIFQRLFMPWFWRPLRKKHLEDARKLLIKFRLEKALSQYPKNLSGGMRQRVAIAQALIMQPKVLLLDEPFGALDEATREELQDMLLALREENKQAEKMGAQPPWTVLIVTHELNEAFYVADRVIGLGRNWKDGNLLGEISGATILWDKPAPVCNAGEPRNYELFKEMRNELRQVVIDDDVPIIDRQMHVKIV